MSIWAPVVAALGASGLTGACGFGSIWWQQHRRDQAAEWAKKRSAYHLLIAQSLSFTIRAQTLRNAMEVRSGLGEAVDVAVRLRRASDPLELHDWLAEGFQPMNEAWSLIQIMGSSDAVKLATDLVDACADLLSVATEAGEARGKIASAIKGLAWTGEQQKALREAIQRVVKERKAFIALAGEELGAKALDVPRELVDQKNAATTHGAPAPLLPLSASSAEELSGLTS